jgi:hypothetical protein
LETSGSGWAWRNLSEQQFEEDLGVAPRHVGVGHAFRRHVTEVAEAVDHLLGRAAADAELQAATGDEVGGAGILRHIHRIFIAHVDDRGADLDTLGLRAAGREQRERRTELAGEMMNAEIRPVRAEFLRRNRELDRLQQRVRRCPRSATAATESSGRRRESRRVSRAYRYLFSLLPAIK